jgi:hypothetical protein
MMCAEFPSPTRLHSLRLARTPRTVPLGRIGRILLASEPVEGTGGELKLAPESFAIVLASPE